MSSLVLPLVLESGCSMTFSFCLLWKYGAWYMVCRPAALWCDLTHLYFPASLRRIIQPPLGIHDLPPELLPEIASHLDFIDVILLGQVRHHPFHQGFDTNILPRPLKHFAKQQRLTPSGTHSPKNMSRAILIFPGQKTGPLIHSKQENFANGYGIASLLIRFGGKIIPLPPPNAALTCKKKQGG